MNLIFLRGVFFALSALAVASGATAYWIWAKDLPEPIERATVDWAPPKLDVSESKIGNSDLSDYSESFARPVFSPTRRPFVPQLEEPVPEVQSEPTQMVTQEPVEVDVTQIVLKGVRLNLGERQALMLSAASPVAKWLSLGGEIEGFELVEISDDRVTLVSGQRKVNISLYGNGTE